MKRFFLVFILMLACVGVASADTLIVYTANSTDGNVYRVGANQTFIGVRDGAGTGFDVSGATAAAYIRSDLTTNTYDRLYRTALIFDTSGIPDTATLNSGLIGLYRFSGYTTLADTGLNIVKFNIDGTISADDYDNFETTRYSTDQNASTITTAKYYNWSLDTLGISNISKTGNTGLGSRFSFDIDNTSPTWVSGGAKIAGAAWRPADYVLYPPFLQIEYSEEAPPTPAPTTAPVADDYPICEEVNFFFWNDSSTFGTDYNRLATFPQLEDAKILSTNVTSTTGEQTIGSFITEPFPTGKILAPGLTRYRTYLNVSSAVGITKFDFIPYNVSPAGIETRMFFGVPRTEDVNELDAREYLTSYARRNYTYFLPGERLLIRVNASTTSVVARDAYFNIVGTEKASMVQVGYWICPDPTISTWVPEINPPSPDSLIGTIKAWIKNFLKGVFS